jgi:hypothetical protein
MDIIDDISIIRRLNQGDAEAFKLIYLKYSTRIFNFCRKLIPNTNDASENIYNIMGTKSSN